MLPHQVLFPQLQDVRKQIAKANDGLDSELRIAHLKRPTSAGDEVCRVAASSARSALGAVIQCVPPPADSDVNPAFPLTAALSPARPSSSLEALQQAQSQLLSSLRVSVATEMCADAETLAAFASPLMAADDLAESGHGKGAAGDDGEVAAVLHIVLACCAAAPAFCERASSMDLQEVRFCSTLWFRPAFMPAP